MEFKKLTGVLNLLEEELQHRQRERKRQNDLDRIGHTLRSPPVIQNTIIIQHPKQGDGRRQRQHHRQQTGGRASGDHTSRKTPIQNATPNMQRNQQGNGRHQQRSQTLNDKDHTDRTPIQNETSVMQRPKQGKGRQCQPQQRQPANDKGFTQQTARTKPPIQSAASIMQRPKQENGRQRQQGRQPSSHMDHTDRKTPPIQKATPTVQRPKQGNGRQHEQRRQPANEKGFIEPRTKPIHNATPFVQHQQQENGRQRQQGRQPPSRLDHTDRKTPPIQNPTPTVQCPKQGNGQQHQQRRQPANEEGFFEPITKPIQNATPFVQHQQQGNGRQRHQQRQHTNAMCLMDHTTRETPPIPKAIPVMQRPKQDGVPQYWDKMHKNTKCVYLDGRSAEYKQVEELFTRSMGTYSVEIVSIERIQIKTLHKQFVAMRTKLRQELKQYSLSQLEKKLWHGTTKDSVGGIVTNGFDRGYKGKNATLYGQGTYFARDAHYSAAYAVPDDQDHQRMFLCEVLVGDYTLGTSEMSTLPTKHGNVRYNSTVNDMTTPSIFVIYHDTQAYPEHLVTFRCWK